MSGGRIEFGKAFKDSGTYYDSCDIRVESEPGNREVRVSIDVRRHARDNPRRTAVYLFEQADCDTDTDSYGDVVGHLDLRGIGDGACGVVVKNTNKEKYRGDYKVDVDILQGRDNFRIHYLESPIGPAEARGKALKLARLVVDAMRE